MKGKDILIGILFGVNIVLVTLMVLILTGIVKIGDKEENIDNGIVNDVVDNNNNNVSDNAVDSATLDKLYNIIGILPNDELNKNICLSYEVSQNNYRDNAKKIFSWYASLHNLNTHHSDAVLTTYDGVSISVYNAAATRSISKSDANKIIALYNFNNIDNFFKEMPDPYSNEYYYTSYTNQPDVCNYGVEHNATSEVVNSSIIRVTDNQVVKEYDLGNEHTTENVKSTKNQVVVYEFNKNNEGEYYLNNVVVK